MSGLLLSFLLLGITALGCSREGPSPAAAQARPAEETAVAAPVHGVQLARRLLPLPDWEGEDLPEVLSAEEDLPEHLEYEEDAAGIVLVFVPGGPYYMGAMEGAAREEERPSHRVSISDFWIGKYEVTQRQWARVMGANPAFFPGEDRPVEQVSWDEVQAFVGILAEASGKAYRLPTEAEWEFAARDRGRPQLWAGTSDVFEVCLRGWYSANSGSETQPVGLLEPNGLGLHDMTGNVWEWCHDRYGPDYYAASPVEDPPGPPDGAKRVLRGGSCDNLAFDCRTTFRLAYPPEVKSPFIGFRIAVSSP